MLRVLENFELGETVSKIKKLDLFWKFSKFFKRRNLEKKKKRKKKEIENFPNF